MSQLFVLGLGVLTSVGAYIVGTRWLGLSRRELAPAVSQTLEFVGMSIVFFVANLAIGLTVVLAVRGLTPIFLSVYPLNDVSFIVISGLQALLFASWRGRR